MIALASDHAGYELKEQIKLFLIEKNFQISDFGTHNTDSCDYPDFCISACQALLCGECDRAILVCGTGIGMSMTANGICGIRCGLCTNEFMARSTRAHNDANVLALGARVTDTQTAIKIVQAFLTTDFEGGRHVRRIEKMKRAGEIKCCKK